MLNTDPAGREGTAPTQWRAQDLAARVRGVRHSFVLGHKPAVPAPANDGLSNGGSPLDASAAPNKLFFGYTLIKIFTSGRVMAYGYGRDLPASGYLGSPAGIATTLRDSVEMALK